LGKINNVWVFAEATEALAELCARGRQLGELVTALVIGPQSKAEQIIRQGADRVFWLGEPDSSVIVEAYTETILGLLEKEQPSLLLMNNNKRAKLIAGRLAAKLETTVLTDVMEFVNAGDKLQVKHMVYGGAAIRIEQAITKVCIATVGAGTFEPLLEDGSRQGTIISVEVIFDSKNIKLLERRSKGTTSVNIAAAKRIVGVGRGIVAQEDIKLAEELAALLGAEIGCTRPLAEGVNWLPKERYIGVSGVMSKPDVYFALGISGQIQHMVGINQAKTIIAVNKDKNSLIFNQADYGVIGDLYKIVPALIGKLKAGL